MTAFPEFGYMMNMVPYVCHRNHLTKACPAEGVEEWSFTRYSDPVPSATKTLNPMNNPRWESKCLQ